MPASLASANTSPWPETDIWGEFVSSPRVADSLFPVDERSCSEAGSALTGPDPGFVGDVMEAFVAEPLKRC
jgi:hypothetical protein